MADRHETLQRFAGFTVDLTRRRLLKDGECVAITAKAFETLRVLIEHRGETLCKADLMNAVWGDVAVEENNLTQQISALRRAFGERPDDHRFIVTVPGVGYTFVAKPEDSPVPISGPPEKYADHGSRFGYLTALAYILLVAVSFMFQGSRPGRPQSLAVLEFKSVATGDDFIGAGISDTLRARLGSVEDIVVKPAVLTVDQDAMALGRDLQVDAIVVGSVQRDHDRIRVAIQMVDVAGGRIIWGKTFDEAESNVFALQDSIVVEVAKVLNVRVARFRAPGSPLIFPA
jgi:DNA-binding winged helix-turn-helix (wHTH) protein/TolB-like protein